MGQGRNGGDGGMNHVQGGVYHLSQDISATCVRAQRIKKGGQDDLNIRNELS